MRTHWLRGGFPNALLAPDVDLVWRWLENFIRTFLEKDVKDFNMQSEPVLLKRLLTMLGHLHGNLLNISDLSRTLGISQPTIRKYLDVLEGAFIIQRLQPYYANVTKRLVKSPKIYIRDSGILHELQNIRDLEQLYGHPTIGASWEGYVIEQIRREAGTGWQLYFYRTHTGAEADLVLIDSRGKLYCIEIKSSNAPKVSRGFYTAAKDLSADEKYVIIPDGDSYPKDKDVFVYNLKDFLNEIINKNGL